MIRTDTHRAIQIDEIERRLKGPPRIVRIEPWGQLAICAAVAAAIGAMLAIGGAF